MDISNIILITFLLEIVLVLWAEILFWSLVVWSQRLETDFYSIRNKIVNIRSCNKVYKGGKFLEQKLIFQIGTLNPHGINKHFLFY